MVGTVVHNRCAARRCTHLFHSSSRDEPAIKVTFEMQIEILLEGSTSLPARVLVRVAYQAWAKAHTTADLLMPGTPAAALGWARAGTG